jgi:hypothetical protein
MTRAKSCFGPVLVALALAMVFATGAFADGGATWRSAPALAPPPPAGVAPALYPVPVGKVGQISFWAPNRGLLITGGSGPVEAGLYAYNGVDWHQLSTVCGGSEGRIAWAGPDEFWTISDQRSGQQLPPNGNGSSLISVSLCHFLDGQVVGSYAMPLEEPESYLKMNAAACDGPSDCWFGGEDGHSPNLGAFHLHWNGSTVAVVYGAEDHAITGMVNFQGQLYEGVQIRESDVFPPAFASGKEPAIPVIHKIGSGEGSSTVSGDVIYEDENPLQPIPEYGQGVPPYSLGGFTLASNGLPLGGEATQLWAAADPANEGQGPPTLLHGVVTNSKFPNQLRWSQVKPPVENNPGENKITKGTAPAPEPGGNEDAWLSLARNAEPNVGRRARVVLLGAGGQIVEEALLPGPQDEEVGFRGTAGPITCPAAHDCWMATEAGWLFHLTNGTQYSEDTDPSFAGVITYRPPDSGVPVIYPDAPPLDDSLANQKPLETVVAPLAEPAAQPTKAKQGKALVLHIKSRFLHRRVLQITFTLTGRAHVQLLGRRKGKVIAKTRDESLRPGRHKISLSLNPADWPTKLQFKATPIGAKAPSGESSPGSSSGGDTVST